MKPKIRTRNDRKRKKSGIMSLLGGILLLKKHKDPTFWQLIGRRCKSCVYMSGICPSERVIVREKHLCCKDYEPKRRNKRRIR